MDKVSSMDVNNVVGIEGTDCIVVSDGEGNAVLLNIKTSDEFARVAISKSMKYCVLCEENGIDI
jgi:hypothetical protein